MFPVREARSMIAQLGNPQGFVTVPRTKLFVQEEEPEVIAPIARAFLVDGKTCGDR